MDYLHELIIQIELHSPEGIKECFAHGINPNDHFRGEPLLIELTSEYTRSPRFKDCVKAFVDHGLEFDDKILLAILLDDAGSRFQKNIHFAVPIRLCMKSLFYISVLNSFMYPVLKY